MAGFVNLGSRIESPFFCLNGTTEKNMRDVLGHLFELDSNMFKISFKAGAALFPDDGAGC
jgi:hypothetical protein